jgi:hypothetical protein
MKGVDSTQRSIRWLCVLDSTIQEEKIDLDCASCAVHFADPSQIGQLIRLFVPENALWSRKIDEIEIFFKGRYR